MGFGIHGGSGSQPGGYQGTGASVGKNSTAGESGFGSESEGFIYYLRGLSISCG